MRIHRYAARRPHGTPPPQRCAQPSHRGVLLPLLAAGLMLVSPAATPPAAAASTVITTKVSDPEPAYGQAVRITGRVTGRKPASRIHLLFLFQGTSSKLATTTIGKYGRYSFTWAPPLADRSTMHFLQVVAPKTHRKPKAWGDLIAVTPGDAPFDPQTLRPEYLKIVNDARAQEHLPPLTMVEEYTEIANGVAKELHDRGGDGAYPDNVYGRFPSNVHVLGVCGAYDIGPDSYNFQATPFDLTAEGDHLAVGIYEQPDGRATVIIYTIANPAEA